MATFKLLVTGSRGWKDRKLVFNQLWMIGYLHGWRVEVHHGDCPPNKKGDGLDWIVKSMILDKTLPDGFKQVPHPADWKIGGLAAGMYRNTYMVDLRPDLCCGWIMPCLDDRCSRHRPHGTHGASDCATKAEEAGIETWRFTHASQV